MNKKLLLSLTLAVLTNVAFAQIEAEDACNPEIEECVSEDAPTNQNIYPFKPLKTEDIQNRVTRLTENKDFLWDIREMNRRGLNSARTKNQPWGGSYWPLNQGQIANTYQNKDFDTYIFSPRKHLSWETNYNNYVKRSEKVYPKIYDLDEKDLAKLAPSEKYDLLLGDTSFDLTHRVWDYAQKWGSQKKWGFLSSINLPAGYRVAEANSFMALWEGICHGWAIAAGHSARPEKTVVVTLPNGKKMPFYPNDIKALISLTWANSTIQDDVLFEGLRCNQKRPKKDANGRYIDTKIDKNDTELLPRCADVHPAVYHASIVNIIGLEGRSIVVDKSAKASVSNQPVAGYDFKYFNPETGKHASLEESILPVEKYAKDPFKSARNPNTKAIVGVDMTLHYVDWESPRPNETNFPSDDKLGKMDFNYDLELDASGKIIGGQWRVKSNGRGGGIFGGSVHQPDFFWVVPKNWKESFKPVAGLPEWNFNKSTLPPQEFAAAAKNAHSFTYQMTKEFGFNEKCPVFPLNKKDPILNVDCEFKYPRPQPLINVVDKLLEMSRR